MMTMVSARVAKREFRKWQKNAPNFMTPDIVKLFKKGKYVIELSKGRSLTSGTIYGVTVAKRTGKNQFETSSHRFSSLNTSFSSKSEAEKYIKNKVKPKL